MRSAGSGPSAWFAVPLVAVFLLALPVLAHGANLEVAPIPLGQVTSVPAGIDCPGTCTASFADGATVTLTATPPPNYVFGIPDDQGAPLDQSGWTDCDADPANPLQCSVQLTSDKVVSASFRPAALLLVVANGGNDSSVTATVPDPQPGETGEQTCNSSTQGGVVCPYPYIPGRAVTLTPSPLSPPGWPVWSDDDCIDGTPCTVPLDENRRSVTATFATQHVWLRLNGVGRVESPGATCEVTSLADSPKDCYLGIYPTGQDVSLTAIGTTPKWTTDPDPARAGCDFTDATGAVCHVIAERSRWTVVSFGGVEADQQYPPKAGVHFSVRKAGGGSGTVRGGPIDCGSHCSADLGFGDRYTLVADASVGSLFVGWRRGCGERPRCPLTLGPTSRVTAVFARAAITNTVHPPTKLRVALSRIRVHRKGRRYTIAVPIRVNLNATVTATLTRRGRRVATRRWKVKAGRRVLVIRVAARRGRYRLALRIQSADGQVTRVRRTVRLR